MTATPHSTLTATDLAALTRLGIEHDIIANNGLQRVTDHEARNKFGIQFETMADCGGIVFPYFDPVDGHRTTARVRRDHHEYDDKGKPQNKYVLAAGDGRHVYIPKECWPLLGDPTVPVVLVESEKAALALIAWARRMGIRLIVIALGGCWSWRGRIGIEENARTGEREEKKGPLPDLNLCNGHPVRVLLDSNVATNPKVQAAERELVRELTKKKRGCSVLICDPPVIDGCNGPDDYIATYGDLALKAVLDAARAPSKIIEMPPPKPEAPPPEPSPPPFTDEEAAMLTGELLKAIVKWIKGYVVVTKQQAVIMAVWVLHTYVIDVAEWTPYLNITAPEKATGKTLLMDVLAAVASNSRTASGTTPAALVRIVDKYQPTLFLDEIDASTKGDKEMAEAQRGILNAGFKRGGVFYKCDGKEHEVRPFHCFGPKCFAGIGDLPDTVASRSIIIEMRRKLRTQTVARYRSRKVDRLAAPLRTELGNWGARIVDLLRTIEPEPIEALNDRANDVAEILLIIAQAAGADWLKQLSLALLTVYGAAAADDTSMGVVLLSDLRDIFAERDAAHIPSRDLTAALCEIEGRLWAEWSRGRGLSPNNLARLLRKYCIYPANIRVGEKDTPKGYRRIDFEDIWERYCPPPPNLDATRQQAAPPLNETLFSNRHSGECVADQKAAQTSMDTGSWRCSGLEAGGSEKGVFQEQVSTSPQTSIAGANGRVREVSADNNSAELKSEEQAQADEGAKWI